MKNEINHREPRAITEAGTIEPHDLCSTSFGWHSTSSSWRAVDNTIEILGPGVILYLRMLKYFACWFFVFFLISLPSFILFWQGSGLEGYTGAHYWFARGSLGNLDKHK
jgi:hypothetical protein